MTVPAPSAQQTDRFKVLCQVALRVRHITILNGAMSKKTSGKNRTSGTKRSNVVASGTKLPDNVRKVAAVKRRVATAKKKLKSVAASEIRSPCEEDGRDTTKPYHEWTLAQVLVNTRRGLPFRFAEEIRQRLSLSLDEMAKVLGVAKRTLYRRKHAKRLQPEESERTFRIARLLDLAVSVFESEDAAHRWFKRPNFALGDMAPIEVAASEHGGRAVEDLLIRIEHGIPT